MYPTTDVRRNDPIRSQIAQFFHFVDGIDGQLIDQVLTETGLKSGVSDEDRGTLSLDEFFRVVHALNEPERIPGCLLRYSQSQQLLDYGIVGYAMASSSTVGDAVQIGCKYAPLSTVGYGAELIVAKGNALLKPCLEIESLRHSGYILEIFIGESWRTLQLLLSHLIKYKGAEISVAFSAPTHKSIYRRLFPCSVAFNKPETYITFPEHWLDMHIDSADNAIAGVCRAECERLFGRLEIRSEIVDTIRRLLMSGNRERFLRLEEAAEILRMSVNTLRYQLYREETSYRKIVYEIKMELAGRYLEDTDLALKEIAYLLDYSQCATFQRAFKKWYGTTPHKYRRSWRTKL